METKIPCWVAVLWSYFLTPETSQTDSSADILASGFLLSQYGYSHEDSHEDCVLTQVNSNRGRASIQQKKEKKEI